MKAMTNPSPAGSTTTPFEPPHRASRPPGLVRRRIGEPPLDQFDRGIDDRERVAGGGIHDSSLENVRDRPVLYDPGTDAG